ncbi:hypothetical protein TYRP_019062 [Tyrophagus putrescentiae]|nr:hypothetical protein TYRP_019062 [Tyrophagus putrescentiae]
MILRSMASYRSKEEYSSDDSLQPCEDNSIYYDDLSLGASSSQGSSSSSDSGTEDQQDSPEEPSKKLSIRRLKNRESAARSRMRIKNELVYLEKEYKSQLETNEKLQNQKELLRTEVSSMENHMIAMSLCKLDSDQLSKKAKLQMDLLDDHSPYPSHNIILSGAGGKLPGISIASH